MAYTIENNQPSAGCIRWSNLHMQYLGTDYTITGGYTNYIYAYWSPSTPTALVVSNTFPTLGPDDCLVFLNKSGIAVTVPNATVLNGDLIVPGSIVANAIAANTITGDKIAAGAITATNIAAGTITATQIAVDAVGASAIAANSVNTSELVAGAVTAAKIAAGTITANEIAANTITAAKIAAGTITATQMAAGTITGDMITGGTISGVTITGVTMTGASITASNTLTIGADVNKSHLLKFSGGNTGTNGTTLNTCPTELALTPISGEQLNIGVSSELLEQAQVKIFGIGNYPICHLAVNGIITSQGTQVALQQTYPSFTAATLQGSWVNFGSPQMTAGYYKDALGFVHLRGTIKGGAAGSNIMTLPAGCRSTSRLHLPCVATSSSDGFGSVMIPASGDANNGYLVAGVVGTIALSLDGIVFPASA